MKKAIIVLILIMSILSCNMAIAKKNVTMIIDITTDKFHPCVAIVDGNYKNRIEISSISYPERDDDTLLYVSSPLKDFNKYMGTDTLKLISIIPNTGDKQALVFKTVYDERINITLYGSILNKDTDLNNINVVVW